ncbi:hypothetical protein G7046_g1928 [Stylonectria norvegica]|nr:hypothetical protein G7046_g1928 [Stylonectria norvegica]
MMPSAKRIHGRRLVPALGFGSGASSVSSTSIHVSSSVAAASFSSVSSSTLVWTAYVWRLLVSMLAPPTALLPIAAWAASVVWGAPVPDIFQQHQLASHDAAGFACFSPGLPNITIYATGGTIAGSASSADQTTGYQAATLGIQALIDAVPQLCNAANVRGVQMANEDSTNMNSAMLVTLAQRIQEDLDSPHTQGVVVTHGSDTMEETAFFVDLTVESEKPVVFTGSMRPATAISADGPMNLLSSVILAASESARNRGVMLAMNDRIGSARFTTKSNANSLDTFRAADEGFLGIFENIQPIFFYPPSRPLGHHHFDISKSSPDDKLPQVDVLYGHQELNMELFTAALHLGAEGIVLAGLGAGYWPSAAVEAIHVALEETDVPVVVSRRTAWGFVGSSDAGIGGGFLNPQKARIQLQLCLELGLDAEAIKAIFEHTGVH